MNLDKIGTKKTFGSEVKDTVASMMASLQWAELTSDIEKDKILNFLMIVQITMNSCIREATGHGLMDEDVVFSGLSFIRISDEKLEKNAPANIGRMMNLFYSGAISINTIGRSIVGGIEHLFDDIILPSSEYLLYRYAGLSYVKQIIIGIIAEMTINNDQARFIASKSCRDISFFAEYSLYGDWYNINTDENRIFNIVLNSVPQDKKELFQKAIKEYRTIDKTESLNKDYVRAQEIKRRTGWDNYKDAVVSSLLMADAVPQMSWLPDVDAFCYRLALEDIILDIAKTQCDVSNN